MSLINIKLADEELEQLEKGGPKYGPQLSKLLDAEILNFDTWMQATLGGTTINIERAILKTYLYHKIVGRVEGAPAGAAPI